MPVNDTTANRAYQKPNIANTLADDVGRLRSALDSIDADMVSKAPIAAPTFTGVTTVAAGSAAAPSLTFTGATGDTGLYSPGADQVAISTGGTGRLFVNASGRVGIGTAAPAGALDVVTGTNRGYFDDSAGNLFRLNAVNAANSAYGPLSLNGSVLTFQTGATERARIDSSGRMLIGTSLSKQIPAWPGNYTLQYEASKQQAGTTVAQTASALLNWGSTSNAGSTLTFGKSRSNTVGTYGVTALVDGSNLGNLIFSGDDSTKFVAGAAISAYVDGTPGVGNMPGRLVFSTTADGASTPTERLRITSAGVLQIADAGNITVGATTGTKIGTATTQKLGFYNATPVVQPAAVADATDAASVITQLNALLARMRDLGLIAT